MDGGMGGGMDSSTHTCLRFCAPSHPLSPRPHLSPLPLPSHADIHQARRQNRHSRRHAIGHHRECETEGKLRCGVRGGGEREMSAHWCVWRALARAGEREGGDGRGGG